MPDASNTWIVPLIIAISGAVAGALITVLSDWALTSIRETSTRRKERRAELREWWRTLRSIVHRFELQWTPWVAHDHANFDDAKLWHDSLFESLLELRPRLGPCEVRNRIDAATSELSRIIQLEMEYQGQAAEAYDDFVATTKKVLADLKNLADNVGEDVL